MRLLIIIKLISSVYKDNHNQQDEETEPQPQGNDYESSINSRDALMGLP